MVTEVGGIALASLADRLTTTSEGAAPLRVILFALVEAPPITAVGDSVSASVNGFTVTFTVIFAPAYVAEIATTVWTVTGDVVSWN